MEILQFILFLNQINLNIISNKSHFYFKKTQRVLLLCDMLIKFNIIKYVKVQERTQLLKIVLNYQNKKPICKKLFVLSTKSKYNAVSKNQLSKINRLQAKQLYIIWTNNSLKTHFDALKLKVGGILLAKLSF